MNERAVFLAALEIDDPERRAAYLQDACGDDTESRRNLEELLQASAAAGSFLDTPAVDLGSTASDTESHSDLPLEFLDYSDGPEVRGRLGNYEITDIIGLGGMGIVLQGRDTRLERVVAVKVLAPQLAASPSARQRFLREARAAAAVRDEHVVTIYAVEEAAGLPYLVMELISGMSLQERIDERGPLGVKEILLIGMQTAQGLAAAHAQGLIHRDVKPANILLENGVERVKLTDFGLARVVDDASITQRGVVAGTPQYMAPEQARGEAVDHRADLFSLGSVLYAMCTGQSPFRATGSMAVLKRVCEDTPRPIAEINPEIPGWLCEIIAKLHAKNPAQRFQTAAEVAELLSQHLAHLQQPSVTPLPPRVEKAAAGVVATWPRGRRWLAAASIAALLLVGAVLAIPQIIIRIRGKDGEVTEIKVPAGSRIEIEQGGKVEAVAPRDANPPGEIGRFEGHTHSVYSVAFHPSGRRALSGSCDHTVRLWDLETGKEIRQFKGHTGAVWSVAISPGGHRALTGANDLTMRLWDVETGEELRRFEGHTINVWKVAFLPDGRRALSSSSDKTIRLWDLETGKEVRRFEGHTGHVTALAVSPDGRRVLSGGGGWDANGKPLDVGMRLWDVETGQELRRFEGHTHSVWSVALSPDGRHAVSGSLDGTIRLWDVEGGKELRRFSEGGHVSSVAFSPDGHRFLSANGTEFCLWDVATWKPLQRFGGHTDRVQRVVFSPDGRRALTGSESKDKTMRLWQLPPPEKK